MLNELNDWQLTGNNIVDFVDISPGRLKVILHVPLMNKNLAFTFLNIDWKLVGLDIFKICL